MKIVVQILLTMMIGFKALAFVDSNQLWVGSVMKEKLGISRVYFTSGEIMIALVSFSNGTSQFYEITHTEKITTVYQVTAPFKNSDLSQVTERAKYFVMRAEHGRTQMQAGLNLTNGALTAGISSPVGFAMVPLAAVVDTLTAPFQLGMWAGKHSRRYLEDVVLRAQVEAQGSYVNLNDTQYAQVKWALGQALPIAK